MRDPLGAFDKPATAAEKAERLLTVPKTPENAGLQLIDRSRFVRIKIDGVEGRWHTHPFNECDLHLVLDQNDLDASVVLDNFFLYHPIITFQGAILDGYGRALAASKAGINVVNGTDVIAFIGTEEEARRFAKASNLIRKEPSQDVKRVRSFTIL